MKNNSRRRYLFAAAAGALTFALAACSGGTAASTDSSSPTEDTSAGEFHDLLPAAIQSKGSVVVGTEAYYPPYGFLDTDGTTIVGFEPDLLDAITSRLGISYELENVAFDTLLPSLTAGRYDVIAAAMTETPERSANYTFVNHYRAGQAIIVLAGKGDGLDALEDLCGLTVAVLQDSAQESILTDLNGAACSGDPIDVLRQPTDTDALLQVQGGRADASLSQDAVGRYNAAQVGGGSVFDVANKEPLDPRLLGHVLTPENTELAKAWQAALQSLIDDGTYAEILSTWDMSGGALTDATINGTQSQ